MRSNDDDHDNDNNNNNNNMTEVVLSRIAAMRRQEETIYNAPVVDVAAAKVSSSSSASTRGLSSQQRQAQHNDDDHHRQQHDQHQQSCDTAPTSKTSSPETDHRHHHHHHHHHHVDCIRRSKVAAWLYRVADYCHFRRETVNIAITNLDRYMETPAATTARSDRAVYTLAAMTALYTAIKVHDSTVETADLSKRIISLYATKATDSTSSSNSSSNSLLAECKCNFTTKQVECMELEMLMALEWRINPPTALAFCREFLRLVPDQVLSGARRERVVRLVALQTQLAFVDGSTGNSLLAVKASTIAFCAFMNALEMIRVPEKILGFVAYLLAEAVGVNCNDTTVVRVQNKLYQRTTTTTSSSASAASPAVPTTLTPPPLPQRRRHRQERMTTASASLSLSVVGTAVTSHHHNHHDTRSRIRRTARIKQFATSPQSTAVTIPAWY